MKIAVAGTGYVRLSIAILLAQHHHAMAVDIVPEKEEKINNRHLSIYRKVPSREGSRPDGHVGRLNHL